MRKTFPNTSLTLNMRRGQPIGTKSETVCCVVCGLRRGREVDNCPVCELAARQDLSADQAYTLMQGVPDEEIAAYRRAVDIHNEALSGPFSDLVDRASEDMRAKHEAREASNRATDEAVMAILCEAGTCRHITYQAKAKPPKLHRQAMDSDERQALFEKIHTALIGVDYDHRSGSNIVALDGDFLPTTNVNDARWLFSDNMNDCAIVRINADGTMTQIERV